MKWLLLIVPLIVKQFAQLGGDNINPIEEIKDLIKDNVLKIILAFAAASAIGTLFVAGIVLGVIGLMAQYDAGQRPKLTAIMAGGLGMALVSLIIFLIGFFMATADAKADKRKEKLEERTFENTLKEALIILINEFMQNKEVQKPQYAEYENQPDEFERH